MAVAHPVAVETSVHKCVIRPPLFRASEEASLVEEDCRLSGSPRPPWNQRPVHAYVHETEEPHLLKQPLALVDRRIVCIPGLFIFIYPQPAKVTGSDLPTGNMQRMIQSLIRLSNLINPSEVRGPRCIFQLILFWLSCYLFLVETKRGHFCNGNWMTSLSYGF